MGLQFKENLTAPVTACNCKSKYEQLHSVAKACLSYVVHTLNIEIRSRVKGAPIKPSPFASKTQSLSPGLQKVPAKQSFDWEKFGEQMVDHGQSLVRRSHCQEVVVRGGMYRITSNSSLKCLLLFFQPLHRHEEYIIERTRVYLFKGGYLQSLRLKSIFRFLEIYNQTLKSISFNFEVIWIPQTDRK